MSQSPGASVPQTTGIGKEGKSRSMKEFKYVIRDEVGIHARPAGLLVKEAQCFSSAVQIRRGDRTADGKKLFALMALGVKCGDEVTVQCQGEDEDEAARALQVFFRDKL